jgi:gamma-glutamyl:cysteine ligase YbdK (ATP-grasp superfamily)
MDMHRRSSLPIIVAVLLGLGAVGSQAQPRAEVRAADARPADDIPMDDYLALLAQISPAAREGAQAYLQAVQQRCSRTLTTAQLRRAVSEGDGDPILMGMIRASQLQDGASLRQLAQRIACTPRSGR